MVLKTTLESPLDCKEIQPVHPKGNQLGLDREAWHAAVHGVTKNAESQRIDAFELWCWRGLLRIPWTVRRPNQSILKEINPEYSLDAETEAPVFWPPDVKSESVEKP